MKLTFVLLLILGNFINFIALINEKQDLIKKAYEGKKYKQVIEHSLYLINEQKVKSENVYINLANAYYMRKQNEAAMTYYAASVKTSSSSFLKSIAFLQMGLLHEKKQNHQDALAFFKEAVIKDPLNYEARYNYELLKKRLKKTQKKKNKNNNQENFNTNSKVNNADNLRVDENGKIIRLSASENGKTKKRVKQTELSKDGDMKKQAKGEKGRGEGDKPNILGKPTNPEKLKNMKISREKAVTILEALRNQEVQFIQQKQKKSKNRQKKDNQPNW